jgi:beta-glucosidase
LSGLAIAAVGQPMASRDAFESRIAGLIAQMTIEEKVSLLGGTGFDTRPIPRLGIPSLRMTDGPLGVRTGRATAFPASIALAATWDTALVRQVGAALGRETKAKGKNVLLAPCVNIHRNFESFGEDPYVAARMSVAYIEGVQSEGVAATVKHFAVNNQENEREWVDARVSERALREIYLPAFEASVVEADVLAVMNSYNRVNGPYTTESVHLNLDILKGEWGFQGLLMSDWGATHSVAPAANGGLDLEMPFGRHFGDSLLAAVREGAVPVRIIDDHVTRILRVALKDEIIRGAADADTSVILGSEHQRLNRLAATRGIVLLKNHGAVLPLDRSAITSLAVIGPSHRRGREFDGQPDLCRLPVGGHPQHRAERRRDVRAGRQARRRPRADRPCPVDAGRGSDGPGMEGGVLREHDPFRHACLHAR